MDLTVTGFIEPNCVGLSCLLLGNMSFFPVQCGHIHSFYYRFLFIEKQEKKKATISSKIENINTEDKEEYVAPT